MTINEIAEMAGVSRATVSRFLNNGYVSEEKREKIAAVIEETGYTPSSQAKMLRTKKTGLIGVILPKINSDSISRMVAGISEVLAENGYQLLLASTNNDEREEVKYLQTFRNNHVDGVILIGTIFRKEHKGVLKDMSVPVVILGQHYQGSACVYQDDYHAAQDVTGLLTGKCSQIAYIGVTQKDKAVGLERHKGFMKALSKASMQPVTEQEIAFRMEEGYEAMKKIMKTFPQTDGVFCATDTIAAGAMCYLNDYEGERTHQVRIVGMGDSKTSLLMQPRLSTVHFHYKTSGVEAARLLMEMMNDSNSVCREIKMGYRIIARESTD